jgi:hypothetical protein
MIAPGPCNRVASRLVKSTWMSRIRPRDAQTASPHRHVRNRSLGRTSPPVSLMGGVDISSNNRDETRRTMADKTRITHVSRDQRTTRRQTAWVALLACSMITRAG